MASKRGVSSRVVIVIDATGPRVGQEAKAIQLPKRIIETALWWRDFVPPSNDLIAVCPTPVEIPCDRKAEALLRDFRELPST